MNNANPAVLLITPFHKSQRGNTLTTRRIRDGLIAHGIKAELLSLENEGFSEQLHEHLANGYFDIIHAFNGLYLARLLTSHPQLLDHPLIVTLTGTDLNQADSEERQALQAVFAVVRQVVVFHEEFKARLIRCSPAMEDKIVLIPQGIHLPPSPPRQRQDFGIPDECTVFLLPTGLRPVKNVELALDGLEMLAGKDDRVRLLIMGPVIDAVYGKRIIQRIEALPWAKYIGEIPHQQISGIYALGDVVINCSHAEGQPQATLEAMSLGLPAIMSAVPGNRGIMEDGREGFYFSGSRELCQAALTLHADPALRQVMGQAAAELVRQRFDYCREIEQHIDLYQAARRALKY